MIRLLKRRTDDGLLGLLFVLYLLGFLFSSRKSLRKLFTSKVQHKYLMLKTVHMSLRYTKRTLTPAFAFGLLARPPSSRDTLARDLYRGLVVALMKRSCLEKIDVLYLSNKNL